MLYTVTGVNSYSFAAEDGEATPENDSAAEEEQRALFEEWKSRIERLSRLSGEDLKKELSALYRQEIQRGLANPDASFTGIEQSYAVFR